MKNKGVAILILLILSFVSYDVYIQGQEVKKDIEKYQDVEVTPDNSALYTMAPDSPNRLEFGTYNRSLVIFYMPLHCKNKNWIDASTCHSEYIHELFLKLSEIPEAKKLMDKYGVEVYKNTGE